MLSTTKVDMSIGPLIAMGVTNNRFGVASLANNG